MTAAVLCPGPSLGETYVPGGHVFVVAVNRAATAYAADYASVTDSPLLDRIDADLKAPKLLTRAACRLRHSKRPGLTIEELCGQCPAHFGLFSATAAVVLAAWLGATEVDVYGADWKPDAADWDGVNVAERRTAQRFEKEAQVWGEMVEWLASRGVRVRRILPEGDWPI